MSLGTGGQVAVRTIVLALLARLVAPDEFGLVAASLVVVNLSVVVAELGFGPALVQRADLRTDHVRVAFTTLVLLGAVLWGLVAWVAPLIADLYSMPRLTPILQVMAAVFFIRNLTVSDFLLTRELQFRKIATVEFVAYAIGYGGVAVPLGVLGWGVWAIVAGQVTQEVIRVVAVRVLRPHPSRPLLVWEPLRDLLAFGGGNTLARMAQLIAIQGDNFIVGRWLGPVALGLYGRAYQLMAMPAQLFGQILRRVLFPAMSSMQGDRDGLRSAYATATAALALLVLPLSVVAALLAEELILVLLGPDWLPMREAFNVMVFGMLFRASHGIADCVCQAVGAVYRQAGRKAIYTVLVIGGALVGQRWGIHGVAWGVLVALVVNYLLLTQLSLSLTRTSWSRVAAAHLPALLVSLTAGPVCWVTATALRMVGASAVAVVAGSVTAAALAAILLGRVAPVVPPLRSVAALLLSAHQVVRGGRAGRHLRRLLGPRYRASTLRMEPGGAAV